MKVAAIIEEFNDLTKDHESFIRQVRQESQADMIIAVMSGDFLQQGIPAARDKYTRARMAAAAGIDLVLELPVYCTLSSPDTYAYAAISMLESLHCVDELYIACDAKSPSLLFDVARFLFMEPRDYQLRLKAYRSSGMSFYDAQAQAVGASLPQTAQVLKHPVNIFAAEYLRALKRIYSRIQPRLINTPGLSPLHALTAAPIDSPYLDTLLHYELCMAHKKMDEIYGGTSMLTESICRHRDSYANFNDFCGCLSTPTRSRANIRRYMLNLILNIRKSDIAICRLYSFTLYLRVLAGQGNTQKALDYIREHTHTLILNDAASHGHDQKLPDGIDASVAMMAAFDSRAHKIYSLASKNC